jgi:hypothetical protein
MPVIVLDVPIPAWNTVAFETAMLGLDLTPDYHREKGNTVVEITGTWDKLNQVFTRIKKWGPSVPQLLAVMERKEDDKIG